MQSTQLQIGQLPKLFHVQSNTSFDLPANVSIIHIGKPNERIHLILMFQICRTLVLFQGFMPVFTKREAVTLLKI
jgi:hypothetical protein